MEQAKRESRMWIYVNLIGTLIVGVIVLLAIPAIADADSAGYCEVYSSLSSGHKLLGQIFFNSDHELRIEYQYGIATTPDAKEYSDKILAKASLELLKHAPIGESIDLQGETCHELMHDEKHLSAVAAGMNEIVLRYQISTDFAAGHGYSLEYAKHALGQKVADSLQKKDSSMGKGGAPLEEPVLLVPASE